MKTFVAILIGMIAGVLVIYLIDSLSNLMYKMPSDLEISNKKAIDEWINSLPFLAKVLILISWLCGAMAGSFIASYMDGKNAKLASAGVAIVLFIAMLMNAYLLPRPSWMWASCLFTIMIGTWIGYKFRGKETLRHS